MKKVKTVIMADNVCFYKGDIIAYIYGKKRIGAIKKISDLYPKRIDSDNLEAELPKLSEIEVIFSCWGMPKLTNAQLDCMPKLKAIFYAAGSVNFFAQALMKRGITVCNAVQANAIPVAEFCLAQILLSCKNTYMNSQLCNKGPWQQSKMPVGRGVYGETVALLGIGAISRHLLKLLKPFNLRIIAVSGYLSNNPERARKMGIDKLVTIEEAFSEAYIVSNHLPDKESNKGILTKEYFALMRKGATFINTGRGAQVNEADMIEVLKQRPDLTALLDVQYPEPPETGSEFFTMPNIHMTSHISGSVNDEVRRMADFILKDFQRYLNKEPLQCAVNAEELAVRA